MFYKLPTKPQYTTKEIVNMSLAYLHELTTEKNIEVSGSHGVDTKNNSKINLPTFNNKKVNK